MKRPVGFSPLPWYATPTGFDFNNGPSAAEVYAEIKSAGFGAVPAEPPSGMDVAAYKALLSDSGLVAAPGYFQTHLSAPEAKTEGVEAAKAAALVQLELGMDRVFVADKFGAEPRVAHPGVGAGHDPQTFEQIIENLGVIAAAITAEGLMPCLHQHIGTWIESADEIVAALEAIPSSVLKFGPDTGHLAWGGADPVEIITRFRERVQAVHIKDVHRAVAVDMDGADYRTITASHIWTEPGSGDLDLTGALAALGEFDGWFVVEVDVADAGSPEESAVRSAAWVREHIGNPDGGS